MGFQKSLKVMGVWETSGSNTTRKSSNRNQFLETKIISYNSN